MATNSFALESVQAYSSTTLRVSFTKVPQITAPPLPSDALNPANYSLNGPASIAIASVATVNADAQTLELTLASSLPAGTWTLSVANLVSVDLDALVLPASMSFSVLSSPSQYEDGGVEDDDEEALLRKLFSPAFKGEGWNAMLSALAIGDAHNNANAESAFDQLFKSTAVGLYLDRKCADDGITRPPSLGMSDDSFRNFAIRSSANKVTVESLWELLEVFYGTDSVRGHAVTENAEPYALAAGDMLTIKVDESDTVNVTFLAKDFSSISGASALEVAAAISRACEYARSKAYAIAFVDPETNKAKVKIYSGALGLRSSVTVTNGTAQDALRFPQPIDSVSAATVDWDFTRIDPDTVELAVSANHELVDLSKLRVGDFVNLSGNVWPFKGSFEISKVTLSYDNINAVLDQSFEIKYSGSFADSTFTQAANGDMLFYRPTRNGIYSAGERNVVISQSKRGELDVTIPATTQVVSRAPLTGSYAKTQDAIPIQAMVGANESIKVTIGTHSLRVGDRVIVEGVYPASVVPTKTPGTFDNGTNSGTTSNSIFSTVEAMSEAVATASAKQYHSFIQCAANEYILTTGITGTNAVVNTVSKLTITGPTNGVYGYTWSAAQGLGVGQGAAVGIPLDSTFMPGHVLMCGGRSAPAVADNTINKYDPGSNTWSNMGTLSIARFGTRGLILRDGRIMIGPGSGIGVDRTQCDLLSISEAAISVAAATASPVARQVYGMTLLNDGKVLFSGGATYNNIPTNRCDIYDPATDTWTQTGSMNYRRWRHAALALPDGRVLVVGGIGGHATQSTTNGAINSAEIYEPSTGCWRALTNTANTQSSGYIFWHEPLQKAVMVGPSFVELFDPKTGSWAPVQGSRQASGSRLAALHHGNLIVMHGGFVQADNNVTNKVDACLLGESALGVRAVNGEYKIIDKDATSITLYSPEAGYFVLGSTAGAQIVPVAAPATADDAVGPYLFSPDEGFAVTGTETKTTSALHAGRQYRSLQVEDASAFPDAEGWLVLAFGHEEVTGPIRYLGRLSGVELLVDFNYTMPVAIPAGSSVTLLSQKGTWTPTDLVGGLYLTASPAGRIAAETAVQENMATGMTLNKTIVYPGDRGLGNEGYPAKGASKLSDKVTVWGGDSPDDELDTARGE